MKRCQTICALLCFAFVSLSPSSQATIVQFKTSMGDFEVNLFDDITPKTVENFLAYVEQESYHQSVIHRSVPGFIVQGGGFSYQSDRPLTAISANAPIINEPELSNRRGTIAMAKVATNPNSATNQWFFNLDNNSANLDAQNGGFTVFGHVSEQGLQILDTIAALPRPFATITNNVFSEIPLQNYTTEDASAGVDITAENYVIIESITVVDPRTNTAAGLDPIANESFLEIPYGSAPSSGSMPWWLLALIVLLTTRRLFKSA